MLAEFLHQSQTVLTKYQLSRRQLCRSLALPRSTEARWRRRLSDGAALLQSPGSKKTDPFSLDLLHHAVAALAHGTKRTAGTTSLHALHAHSISRRHFQSLVREARTEHQQLERQQLQSIHWTVPSLAWSIDAAEYLRDGRGKKLLFVAAQDLASRFRFAPVAALQLDGRLVAQHLEQLFRQHGPPLLLKRDNGSLFNNHHVDDLLARWLVLPLNSPPYYAPYNGAIENAIGQIKADLLPCLPAPPSWNPGQVTPLLASLCHLHNARPRRCLAGQTACQLFFQPPRQRWTRPNRRAAFDWINSTAAATLSLMEKPDPRVALAAWRTATVRWLRRQLLIRVSSPNKPNQRVTPFFQNLVP